MAVTEIGSDPRIYAVLSDLNAQVSAISKKNLATLSLTSPEEVADLFESIIPFIMTFYERYYMPSAHSTNSVDRKTTLATFEGEFSLPFPNFFFSLSLSFHLFLLCVCLSPSGLVQKNEAEPELRHFKGQKER